MANALARLGFTQSERVATLAWNGYRHFELYYAISGSGYVLHTVNPRLFPEQIAWIINDAEDQVLFFDLTFAPLVEKLAPQCPTVRHWVAMTDRAHMPSLQVPNLLCYEELLERSEEHTSELQSLMRISYAVFCLKKKKNQTQSNHNKTNT